MTASSSSPVQPFQVDVVVAHDEVVLALAGELDLESADVLEREVAALHADGRDRVVIDLRDVGFIDSTGLRVLIGLHRAAEHEGRLIGLVRGPHPVQRIFELTATAPLFHWRD